MSNFDFKSEGLFGNFTGQNVQVLGKNDYLIFAYISNIIAFSDNLCHHG